MDLSHFTIRAFTAPDDLPNEVVRDVIMAKDGSVWLASWGGGIVVMNGTERRIINTDNGLISNDVRVLEEDREGRIWVGTAEGISCIQNQEIINFSTIPLPEIPANDSLFAIESMHNGEVWFGDGFGNLFAWIPANDSPDVRYGRWMIIHHFKMNNECCIRDIQQYNHEIWIAVDRVGLVIFNSLIQYKTIEWDSYPDESFVLDCKGLLLDSDEKLYCVGGKGIFTIQDDQVSNTRWFQTEAKCITSAFDKIFVGTERGLYVLDNNGVSLFSLTSNQQKLHIESVSFLSDKSLWIGTRSGAFRITEPTWRLVTIQQTQALNGPSLIQTNKNELLVLDEHGGLWRYSNNSWALLFNFDLDFSYFFNNCTEIFDNKFVILQNRKLIIFNLIDSSVLQEIDLPEKIRIGGKYQVFLPNKEEIWFTGKNGILQWHGNSFESVLDLSHREDPEVYSLLQIAPGEYWVGGKGWIEHWIEGKNSIPPIPQSYLDINSPIFNSIRTKEGELWFSQLGEGLLRFKNDTWYREDLGTGLKSNYIWSLFQSSNGSVWAGDRISGIMSNKEGRWIKYGFQDGLPVRAVVTVVEDDQNHIWIGVENEGIFKYQPETQAPAVNILLAPDRLVPDAPGVFSFQGYDAWNDTPRDELVYSWRVLRKDHGNVVHDWNPYTSKNSALVPPLPPGDYLFEVRVQDRHRNTSPVSAKSAFIVEPYFWMNPYFQYPTIIAIISTFIAIYLLWQRNKMQEKAFSDFCDTTHIGVLRISSQGEIKYSNRSMSTICGFENIRQMMEHPAPLQWSRPKKFIKFIQALAKKNSSRSIQLDGVQPLTQKKFFSLLYGYPKNGNNEIMVFDMTPQKTLENEIVQISVNQQKKMSSELHDSLSQLLTGIGCLGKSMLEKFRDRQEINLSNLEDLNNKIELARIITRRFTKSLHPMHRDSLDLNTALREMKYDLESIYPQYSITVDLCPELPDLDKEHEWHLRQIAHEALQNAAKHSKAKNISLKTALSNSYFELYIMDDGIGLSQTEKPKGLGLQIMRYRAGLIMAELEYTVSPNGGTCVICRYPLDSI